MRPETFRIPQTILASFLASFFALISGCVVPVEAEFEPFCDANDGCEIGICIDGRCLPNVNRRPADAGIDVPTDLAVDETVCVGDSDCDSGVCIDGACTVDQDAGEPPPEDPPPPPPEDPPPSDPPGGPGPNPGTHPCLELRPAVVDFESHAINVTNTQSLEVVNCGPERIRLYEFGIEDDQLGVFSFDGPSAIAFLRRVSGPGAPGLPAGESASIDLTFRPVVPGRTYSANFAVTIEGFSDFRFTAPMIGHGVENECPRPVLDETEIIARVDEAVFLDGSMSTDPDGSEGVPVLHQWVFVRRPSIDAGRFYEFLFDSRNPVAGGPRDDRETPTAVFVPDEAGDYSIILRVTDEGGLEAPGPFCPAVVANVVIRVETNN